MNENKFDSEEAKKHLAEKEQERKERLEKVRKQLLEKVISCLRNEFKNSSVEVFLVGSITKPYKFTEHSDVDIVLKNFSGDRFELWPRLEEAFKRSVEIILYENSHFQEYIDKDGLKVI